MKITADSTLMKNQKHAQVMAPDRAFEVLQSPDGDSLFFSIGDDHVFYVTREVRDSQTGWTRINLSSSVSNVQGVTVVAKSFAVSQEPTSMTVDMALVVTVNNQDQLFTCFGHASTSNSWSSPVVWTPMPFDAMGVAPPSPLLIEELYLMSITSGPNLSPKQNCFVDIRRDPSNPLGLLDRYYVQPQAARKWVSHALPIDLKAGSIFSCLGHRSIDGNIPGIYTFGAIEDTKEIIFVPQYSQFRPGFPPVVSRLVVPAGVTSIASAVDSSGLTNLFVAASDGIRVFPPNKQLEGSVSTLVVPSIKVGGQSLLAGLSSLSASTIGGRTVVWGINAQRDLVYVSCRAGDEVNPSAWTTPVPLASGVEGFAFYLNVQRINNVLFAHLKGEDILQITQDPVTSEWSSRKLHLPATDVNDLIEYNTFTTQISATNTDGSPAFPLSLNVTATSPVPVYVNNEYRVFTPDIPVLVQSNSCGTITIIQETESLTAVGYTLTVTGSASAGTFLVVDPVSKAMATLSGVTDGTSLQNTNIKTADGKTKALLPTGTTADTASAAASGVKQLLAVKDSLATQQPKPMFRAAFAATPAASTSEEPMPSFGMSFKKGQATFHNHDEAQTLHGRLDPKPSLAANTLTAGQQPSGIELLWGDLVAWIKRKSEQVKSFVVEQVGKAWQFIVKIGDAIYHAILDSVNAIVAGIEFIFQKIKVAFEDLVAWLGFIFDWQDMLRTQRVVENFVRQTVGRMIKTLGSAEESVRQAFDGVEKQIDKWAGITDLGSTDPIGAKAASGQQSEVMKSPESSWAMYHTNNAVEGDTIQSSDKTVSPMGDFEKTLTDGSKFLEPFEESFKKLGDKAQTEIFDKFTTLAPLDLIKRLLALLAETVLEGIADAVIALLELLKTALKGLLDLIDEPIEIPVISPLYEKLTGEKLTVLSVLGLVAGIVVTLGCKIVTNQSPFPDNAYTKALISAKDPDTFFNLFFGSAGAPQPAPKSIAAMAVADLSDKSPHAKPSLAKAKPQPLAQGIVPTGENLKTSLGCVWILAEVGSFLAVPYVIWKSKPEVLAKLGLGSAGSNAGNALNPGGAATAAVLRKKSTLGIVLALGIFGCFTAPGRISDLQFAASPGHKDWVSGINSITTCCVIAKNVIDNVVGAISPSFSDGTWGRRISPVLDCVLGLFFMCFVGGKSYEIEQNRNKGMNQDKDITAVVAVLCQAVANIASLGNMSSDPRVKAGVLVVKIGAFSTRGVFAYTTGTLAFIGK